MATFTCPHCNLAIQSEDKAAQISTTCPHCGATFDTSDEGSQALPQVGRTTCLLAEICMFLGVFPYAGAIYIFALLVVSEAQQYVFVLYPVRILAGLCLAAPFCGIIAGHLARRGMRNHAYNDTAWIRTVIGLFVCYATAVIIVLAGWAFSELRYSARVASCQNNPTELGMIFQRRDSEFYPQLLAHKGRLIFANKTEGAEVLSPDFCRSPRALFCDLDKQGMKTFYDWSGRWNNRDLEPDFDPQEIINKSSYMYLGYAVTNDVEMRAFSVAYNQRIAEGLPFDVDLEVPPGTGTGGGDTLLRLRPLVKMMITLKERGLSHVDAEHIPVMWDRCLLAPDQKKPALFHDSRGISVMYLNNHVENVELGDGKWPLTNDTMRLFWELESQ